MAITLPDPTLPEWIKLLNTYDPAYYTPGKLVTAEEWNTLFLAGVNQGNYLANTLDKLIKEYLPDTFIAIVDFNKYVTTVESALQQLQNQDLLFQEQVEAVQQRVEEANLNADIAKAQSEQAIQHGLDAISVANTALDTAKVAEDNSETAIVLADDATKIAQEALDTINYDTLPVLLRVGV